MITLRDNKKPTTLQCVCIKYFIRQKFRICRALWRPPYKKGVTTFPLYVMAVETCYGRNNVGQCLHCLLLLGICQHYISSRGSSQVQLRVLCILGALWWKWSDILLLPPSASFLPCLPASAHDTPLARRQARHPRMLGGDLPRSSRRADETAARPSSRPAWVTVSFYGC